MSTATRAAARSLKRTSLAPSNSSTTAGANAQASSSQNSDTERKRSSRLPSHPRRLLSRKATKQAEEPGAQDDNRRSQGEQVSGGKGKEREDSIQQDFERQLRPTFPFQSVIPDRMTELPMPNLKDIEWASASAVQFRLKYPLHNPMGPRWYRNHHLAPRSLDRRPPSVFSPSFPPMATSTDHLPDTANSPGRSRTPSGSPAPTPSSSQTRVHDVRSGARPRKISQTAHDNVDMLDHTDPWGTNWHHQSPYDVGQKPDRASPDSAEPSPTSGTRPRRMSMTSGHRHRTAIPSPLSQSTSAVHLAHEPLATHNLPRKLSKRRKPFRGLFGSEHSNSNYLSPPTTSPSSYFDTTLGRKSSKTGSLMVPSIASSANSLAPTEKMAKRGSVLGRLAKRFSIMRRSDTTKSMQDSVLGSRQSTDLGTGHSEFVSPVSRRSVSPQKQPSQTTPTDASKRVPPPSVDADTSAASAPDGDAQSIVSAHDPYPIGRLTVANPDESGSIHDAFGRRDSHESEHRGYGLPVRGSPAPMDDSPSTPTRPMHGPLSVISEGETYLSSPKMQAMPSPKSSPGIPPMIPSLLSLPLQSAAIPMDPRSLPPSSPTLPAHRVSSPPLPEIPTSPSAVSMSLPASPPLQPTVRVDPAPISPLTATFNVSSTRSDTTPTQPRADPSPVIYSSVSSYTDNSPLARASMIVNPPTPLAPVVAMPSTAPTPPSQPNGTSSRPVQDATVRSGSTSKKDGPHRMRSKHTETFKLVRSASGNVHTVGETLVADGEHWVVEPTQNESSRRRREDGRSGGQERPSRRESRRAEKEPSSDESDHQRRHDRAQSQTSGRRYSDAESRNAADPRSSPERRRSTRESQEAARSTRTPVIYAPRQPTTPISPSTAKPERRTSTSASTRPSSEFQSVADLNTVKAKEAWDMERLWKGRSMAYGPDSLMHSNRPNIGTDSRPSTIMSADLHRASTIPSIGDLSSTVSSSHTVYAVEPPHPGIQHAATYPQLPVSHQPAGSAHPRRQSSSSQTNRHASSDRVPFPTADLPSPRSNPLPEPPRLSSYKPSPLPPSLAVSSDGSTSPEYWHRYAGVAVTH